MSDYDRQPTDETSPTPGSEPMGEPGADAPAASEGGMPPAGTNAGALPDEAVPKEHRTWGLIAHLAALAGFTGIPAANILGPLIVWLIKKDEMPFVDEQGKESLNFQITVFLLLLIVSPTVCIGIGFVLLPAIGIAALILVIIAAIKANEGIHYRYPFTWRVIK
jgi:uncharacterized Tic20 family protein